MALSGGFSRPRRALYHWIWNLLDIIFPPQCGGCGEWGDRWCGTCQESINTLGNNICVICGIPLRDKPLCSACQSEKPAYDALRSVAIYHGPLRKAILGMKYHRNIGLGEVFSQLLQVVLEENKWRIDLITAVPLSEQRLKYRGYNQANLLAYPLALATRTQWSPQALSRIREDRSQVGLTGKERRKNVQGAFSAVSNLVDHKSILVVDDVTTTGATLKACSEALKVAGAERVYGLTLARAGFLGDHFINDIVTAEDQDLSKFQPIPSGGSYGAQS